MISWNDDNVCHPLPFTTNEQRNLLSVWTLPHQVSPTLKTTQSASAEAEHIWTHMSMHIHRYTQIHIHSPTYIHIHKCTHTQRDMLKHTYCDTCAHTHIYICSHTYTHTHITFLNFCFIHHRCFHYVNLSRTNLIHYSSYGWQDHFKYLKNASHFLVATLRAVFCMFSFIHVIYFYNFSPLITLIRSSSTFLPTHIGLPTQHNVLPVKKENQNQTNEQSKIIEQAESTLCCQATPKQWQLTLLYMTAWYNTNGLFHIVCVFQGEVLSQSFYFFSSIKYYTRIF